MKLLTELPQITVEYFKLSNGTLLPEEALENKDFEHQFTDEDERKTIERQIRARRGQAAFRKLLLANYGNICMVTGCTLLDVLEAAHIKPYRGDLDNHLSNGLILRSDIHTLFDLNLIAINPSSMNIHVNVRALPEYKKFHGKELKGINHLKKPAKKVLELRWLEFLNKT